MGRGMQSTQPVSSVKLHASASSFVNMPSARPYLFPYFSAASLHTRHAPRAAGA
jgi:hypothetical protein